PCYAPGHAAPTPTPRTCADHRRKRRRSQVPAYEAALADLGRRNLAPCGASSRVPTSASGASLDVVGVGGLHPGEHLPQLLAGGLDRVLLTLRTQLLELRRAGVLVGDEPLRERPGLDVREHRLHVLLHVRVDHPRAS